MTEKITQHTVRHFIDQVADQKHAMAGAVIAASAAQATALGLACIQISVIHQPDALDLAETTAQIEQLAEFKNNLVGWCDQDATAMAQFAALRDAGDELSGQALLCHSPAEISRLALAAATILQNFRSSVAERVRDDLEMSLTLLAGAAQAAMLLLDSNLRHWPEPALLDRFEPVRADLEDRIGQLSPVARIGP